MECTACENFDRVAIVGDTAADLQAAENGGVRWNIGVLSGAHDEDQLLSCPHTAIIPRIAQMPEVLARMFC